MSENTITHDCCLCDGACVDDAQPHSKEPVVTADGEGEGKGEEPWVKHVRAIDVILGGEKTIALHQEFLIRNNNSDVQILKNTKVSRDFVSVTIAVVLLVGGWFVFQMQALIDSFLHSIILSFISSGPNVVVVFLFFVPRRKEVGIPSLTTPLSSAMVSCTLAQQATCSCARTWIG